MLAVALATVAGPTVVAVVTTATGLCAGAVCLVQAGRRRGRTRAYSDTVALRGVAVSDTGWAPLAHGGWLAGLALMALAAASGTWSRFALIFMVVLRQALPLLENRRLARRLEDRVTQRSAELRDREQRFHALIEQSSESLAETGMPATTCAWR
jgi:C4-dicarboxylate-specific signal transduction histidine kinase